MAHSTTATVNCVNIGKKACRLFVTGGDDHKVNLWSIGKPNSLMVIGGGGGGGGYFLIIFLAKLIINFVFIQTLCGHTTPVECVAFDEVLVLAGASNGVIKLWDLEEVKS